MITPPWLRSKDIADVVICIDCTGSMSPCIERVSQNAQNLVEGIQAYEKIMDWRIRLIEYRDLNYDEPIIEYPFTTNIEEFRCQVQKLSATGGGDEPKSTLDAIFKGLDSDWRHPYPYNRFVVVLTDATSHRQMHASTVQPGQPRDVDELINKIYETRANLFLFAPKFDLYEILATVDRVRYEVMPSKNGLAKVDFAELMKVIARTVSKSKSTSSYAK